jgi:mRNA interferase RelE/StbE
VANYKILIKPTAVRELEAVPRKDRLRIIKRIHGLSPEPRPEGAEKLSGQDRYRIRQGDYRVVYVIIDPEHIVVVFKIGHRREVYR